MKVNKVDGAVFDLDHSAVDGLKARLRGKVIAAGDPAYDEARTIWNGLIERRPALVVRPLGVGDVIAAVQFAREHGVLLSIRGGGHNIAGLALADGGLLLDMCLMRGVWVDKARSLAHAQAGCLAGDIDRETQLHGLATVLGYVSQTGATGLTLGGGFGYLTRRFGWTVDNVVGMEVVTADGKLVRADANENSDLFWGLRGGGGNFGVVTGIDYKVHAVGPEIVGGAVAWPAEQAEEVLAFYRRMAEEAPRELTLVSMLRLAPPAPWLPKEVHGKPIVAISAVYSGKPEEGERIVAPFKSFGSPIGDVLVRLPYVQMQSLFDATQPTGRRYYWKSEYLPSVEPGLCAQVIKHAARIQSPHSSIILFQIGGALNDLKENAAPVGNRNARYVVNVGASWERAEDDKANIGWAREMWTDIRPFSTGGTYLNFLTEDDGPERTNAALGAAMQRLAEVKARWDPSNFFRVNRNIEPAREAAPAD